MHLNCCQLKAAIAIARDIPARFPFFVENLQKLSSMSSVFPNFTFSHKSCIPLPPFFTHTTCCFSPTFPHHDNFCNPFYIFSLFSTSISYFLYSSFLCHIFYTNSCFAFPHDIMSWIPSTTSCLGFPHDIMSWVPPQNRVVGLEIS